MGSGAGRGRFPLPAAPPAAGVAANPLHHAAYCLVCPLFSRSAPISSAAGEKARRRDPRCHKYQGMPCPDFRKVPPAAAVAAAFFRPCRAGCLQHLLYPALAADRASVLLCLSSLRYAVRCGCWVRPAAPARFEPHLNVRVSARLLPCPQGTCKRGDACSYAHGVFECWLHPSRYRTQLCKEGAACRRSVCFLAHSVEQLREPTMTAPGVCTPLRPPAPKPCPECQPTVHARLCMCALLQPAP